MRRAGLVLVWIAILFVGWLPFSGYGGAPPTQPDSIRWIEKADVTAEGWGDWTFRSSHFVGYRPLTALSFTADLAAFGPSAEALRLTDLALHLLAGLAVGLLALRLAGPLAGALALAWFLGHPSTDEVLPFLARRSYPLAVLCGFGGFHLCVTAVRSSKAPIRWISGGLGGACLLAALFANELGAVMALALPVIAFAASREAPWRRTAAVTAFGWGCVALGIWIRQSVLQGDSGYEVPIKEPGRTGEILRLYGLAVLGELRSPQALAAIVGAILAVYYVIISAIQGRLRERSAPLGILVILVIYGAVIASEAVWFPRQAYPATALAALVVGIVAAQAMGLAANKTRRLPRAVHVAALLGMFTLAFTDSPTWRGTDTTRLARAEVAQRFASSFLEDTADLEGPGHVAVVVPIPSPPEPGRRAPLASIRAKEGRTPSGRASLRVPLRWVRFAVQDREWTAHDVLYVTDPAEDHPPSFQEGAPPRLQLPENVVCHAVRGRRVVDWPGHKLSYPLPAPKSDAVDRYLWIYGQNGGLVSVPR
jgi:hypothetical protein